MPGRRSYPRPGAPLRRRWTTWWRCPGSSSEIVGIAIGAAVAGLMASGAVGVVGVVWPWWVLAVSVGIAVTYLWRRRPWRVGVERCGCDPCVVSAYLQRDPNGADDVADIARLGWGVRRRRGPNVTLALREARRGWRTMQTPVRNRRVWRVQRDQMLLERVMGAGSVRYVTMPEEHARALGAAAVEFGFEVVVLPETTSATAALAATLAERLGLIDAYRTAGSATGDVVAGRYDDAAAGFPAAACVLSDVLTL